MKTILKNSLAVYLGAFLFLGFISASAFAKDDERFSPYIMADISTGDMATKIDGVRAKLVAGGFTIVGEYTPYPAAHIIIITNDTLKNNAAKSEFGGYGAAIRVAITKVNDDIQTSYVDPRYMAQAYRMKGDLVDVAAQLVKTLGVSDSFGSKKGLTADKLRKYKYMFPMESFDDQNKLAEHPNFEAATSAVEAALAEGRNGNKKVYRIDVPGKKETIFGVAMTEDKAGDAYVMNIIDWGLAKHSAHLPYEVLVSGGKIYALHGRFRIAQSFPDLTMGTFSKIMSTPSAIEKNLKTIAK